MNGPTASVIQPVLSGRAALGSRLRLLEAAQELTGRLGFKIPEFVTLLPERFPVGIRGQEALDLAMSLRQELMELTRGLIPERIFVRPCPVDESFYPGLSFAGVFDSAPPKRTIPKSDHLVAGLARVLSGRFTDYANYYYRRHQIESNRQIGVMFMGLVERPMVHGTGYVYQDKILTEFYDSVLAVQMHDPVVLAITEETKSSCGQERLADVLFGLARAFTVALDIEYLVDTQGQIYIVQIRPISQAHLRHWNQLSPIVFQDYASRTPPAVVLNSIGNFQGVAVDLRHRRATLADFLDRDRCIFVINHVPVEDGMSAFDFLQFLEANALDHVNLIVDHGKTRELDHLQYILVEDPGIDFVIQTTSLVGVNTIADGKTIALVSNGLNWHIEGR